jgi:hypothetical protein
MIERNGRFLRVNHTHECFIDGMVDRLLELRSSTCDVWQATLCREVKSLGRAISAFQFHSSTCDNVSGISDNFKFFLSDGNWPRNRQATCEDCRWLCVSQYEARTLADT